MSKCPEQGIAPELGLSSEKSQSLMSGVMWLNSQEQATAKYLGTPEHPGAFAQVLKETAEFMVTQKAITTAPEVTTYQNSIFDHTSG